MHLKFTLRTLFKTPFVTAIAIASLALGIGATAGVFSVYDQVLLRPLPVPQPDRLVNFAAPGPNPGSQSCGEAGNCNAVFSYPMFRDLQREQTSFSGIAAHYATGANLAARGKTRSGEILMVSGSYFPVLNIKPTLGRLLTPDDDRRIGESAVAVLSYDYWNTSFGQDPAVLNQTLIVNGHPLTIVGVGPRGFDGTTFGQRPDVFVPITLRAQMQNGYNGFDRRTTYSTYLFGRLKPGVSMAQAQAAINVPYHGIINTVEVPLQSPLTPETMQRFKAKVLTLSPGFLGQSQATGQATTPLSLLLGVTLFVLLIACANIANLLLARGAARSGEMAVRLSIGAGRWRLIRQLLAESCLLALFGGLLGLAVARVTVMGINSLMPSQIGVNFDLHLDQTVLLFAALLTVTTGVLFGLFPALNSTRPDLITALRGDTGQPSGGRTAARFRTSLATVQVALSMCLLVCAGLFVKSLANISRVDLGLELDHLVTFGVSPELNGYTGAQSQQFFRRLEDALQAIPGVTAAAAGMVPELSGSSWGNDVSVEGIHPALGNEMNSRFNEVGPGYFRTIGDPLVSGREFSRADGVGAPRVAIVNQEFVRRFGLGSDVIGRHIGMGDNRPTDLEIVGEVRNAAYNSVKDSVPPLFFTPYIADSTIGSLTFYLRTTQDPESVFGAIRHTVAQLDPNLPVEDMRTMEQQARDNVFLDRFIGILATSFAVLATLLASIGLYGVLAYTVAQRTRELGLRMALGAAPHQVRGLILKQVGRMTVIGGVIGVLVALALGRLIQSLLYRMQGYDPVVLTGAALGLAAVAMAAGYVPARRAAAIDPQQALRYE
jgi:putative ABC transport system permease protein